MKPVVLLRRNPKHGRFSIFPISMDGRLQAPAIAHGDSFDALREIAKQQGFTIIDECDEPYKDLGRMYDEHRWKRLLSEHHENS